MPEPVQQQLSRTAPGRLEAFENDSDEEHTNLKKKLAKSAQEDVVGNYFKPQRAVSKFKDMSHSRAGGSLFGSTGTPAQSRISPPNTNLASSFNSGLNTVGLNNGYQNGGG